MGVEKEVPMRAILVAAAMLGFLLSGCGSGDGDKKKPPAPAAQAGGDPAQTPAQPQVTAPAPAKDTTQWYDYGPGDPRGDLKALKRAKETIKKAEATRKDVPEEDP
jgi:hypothetical protein